MSYHMDNRLSEGAVIGSHTPISLTSKASRLAIAGLHLVGY
jgi:hypothetical protein